MEDCQVAAELRARLAESIGRERFELWFGPQTTFRFSERALTVHTSSTFARDWLRRNFSRDVRACCQVVTGRDMLVEFEVEEPVAAAAVRPVPSAAPIAVDDRGCRATAAPHAPSVSVRSRAGKLAEPSPARREPTLAAYVVGKGNEYAFGAAEMTIRGAQQASPVLFHGPTGIGKTHLLRAIRAEYRQRHPRARSVYLTAEQFTSGYVEALRGSGLPSFRQKCRGAELFVLDDVQFFAGKRATLEELLHTLDTMLAEGKQMVLASDRSLAELRPLGREIISRLAGGLVCEIQPPDFATRLGIVRRLSGEMALKIDEDVAGVVATQITAGARELRGALYRLQAVSRTCRQPMTRQFAENTLAKVIQQCVRTVRLADVEHAVCDLFGVESAQLRSDRKHRSVNVPRMLAMWLARKYTRAPWSEIGQHFGRRSHSTVISAHRRVERLIRTQAEIGVSDQTCGVEDAIRRLEMTLRTA